MKRTDELINSVTSLSLGDYDDAIDDLEHQIRELKQKHIVLTGLRALAHQERRYREKQDRRREIEQEATEEADETDDEPQRWLRSPAARQRMSEAAKAGWEKRKANASESCDNGEQHNSEQRT